MESPVRHDDIRRQVREVIDEILRTGTVVSDADGTSHTVFPVAISADEGEALRSWVVQEGATRTVEVGLGYGVSALHICEGLVANDPAAARHVVIDPFQSTRFADAGLQLLRRAGVAPLIEHHAEPSHFVLPRLLGDGRQFDLGFIDGNHRFDAVFLDLYYLRLLVRRGGVIILDDYDLPGIRRAVGFFVANLGWTIEQAAAEWVVVRTSTEPDTRHFSYFVDF